MGHIIDFEPSCYEQASSKPLWIDAMMEEYQCIMKNDVWNIVSRPEGKFAVTSKWIYNIKKIVGGIIERHKMRFVARGFSQVEGIDYEETFAHVALIPCFFHMRYDRYVITMMNVSYIENIW